MGIFIMSMPAIGYYGEIRAYVFRPSPNRPRTSPGIFSVTESRGHANLGCKEYARIRLLSHAQMYQRQLSDYKIKALYSMLPIGHEVSIQITNKLKLRTVADFIEVLENPDTIYYV